MKVFVIGLTGGVGSLAARSLQERGDSVSGLVRRAGQRDELVAAGVDATLGDLTTITPAELAGLVRGADAILFTAGAGGAGAEATSAIDGAGVDTAIEAARIAGVRRFLLVSVFPEAWRERNLGPGFDHYIAVKKGADVALTGSGLDWVVLRPAVLLDEPGRGTVALGPAQIHTEVTRRDVADTLVALLHEPRVSRQILELARGATPIADAVVAAVPAG